jgi:exosome complex component RRP40
VRLAGSAVALLPHLAFDGASKRNKPALALGALVFARVATAAKHLEPELSCCVVSGPKRDWTTGQAVFGELRGGVLLHLSSALARRLLVPTCPLLTALGAAVPFEVAVGVNGLVWVAASTPRATAAIGEALESAELVSDADAAAHVERFIRRARGI